MEQHHSKEILEEVKHEAEEADKHHQLDLLPIQYEDLETECDNDETLDDLFLDMVDHCLLYAESVIEFQRFALKNTDTMDESATRADFAELDKTRKLTHDSTIDSINILARNLKEKNKNSKWIKQLSGNRSAYGRFAILIAFARILKDPNLNK
jgi:hypothetical protein